MRNHDRLMCHSTFCDVITATTKRPACWSVPNETVIECGSQYPASHDCVQTVRPESIDYDCYFRFLMAVWKCKRHQAIKVRPHAEPHNDDDDNDIVDGTTLRPNTHQRILAWTIRTPHGPLNCTSLGRQHGGGIIVSGFNRWLTPFALLNAVL